VFHTLSRNFASNIRLGHAGKFLGQSRETYLADSSFNDVWLERAELDKANTKLLGSLDAVANH